VTEARISDHAVQQAIGGVLRFGVLLAAAVTLFGGVLMLIQHGGNPVVLGTFRGEPTILKTLGGIVGSALTGNGDAVAQLGLVLLIATPVARVALTLVAFALQRDRAYVLITTIVLVLLVYGLVFSGA
jgi:uncharacterized membrane protein